MKKNVQPLRGTKDFLQSEMRLFNVIIEKVKMLANLHCYEEIMTPIFEDASVFDRTLGETSDIVTKELYTFLDRDKTNITLRPEFTAAIVRAVLSNGLTQNLPLKFFTYGAIFRHERPQKCRYRQFHQINFEFFGSNAANADVEMIMLGTDILKALDINKAVTLHINSIGDFESRKNYNDVLTDYLQKHKTHLSEHSVMRFEKNPLRILDSKDQADIEIVKSAPKILDYLSTNAANHFNNVLNLLDTLTIPYNLDHKLVRGLDYYTHTIFEFVTAELGSQGTVLAGGRYNDLVSVMGGPQIPAVGLGGGIERLIELYKKQNCDSIDRTELYTIIAIGEECEKHSLMLAQRLREAGLRVSCTYGTTVKKKMQQADKLGSNFVLIFGENELNEGVYKVKNMATSTETTVLCAEIIDFLLRR